MPRNLDPKYAAGEELVQKKDTTGAIIDRVVVVEVLPLKAGETEPSYRVKSTDFPHSGLFIVDEHQLHPRE